jgi:hypothetical protein
MPLRSDSVQAHLNEIEKILRKLPTTSGGGTSDSTAANQVIGNASLSSIDTKTPTVGQKTMAASSPVVIASNQSAIPVSDSIPSVVSTNNSSIATLGIAGVFTGTSEDVSNYSEVRVSVISDQSSAVNGLSIQFSKDGTNWDFTDTYTVTGGTANTFVSPRYAQFFRIVYTNGGVAQTSFRLSTILNKVMGRGSAVRPQDARTNEIDTEETSTYPMVYNGTTWDRARGNTTDGQYVTQIDKTATGTITAINGNVALSNISAYSTLSIQTTGTWTAVGGLTIQGSLDGTNWIILNVAGGSISDFNSSNGNYVTLTSTINNIYRAPLGGIQYVRVIALGAVTGTINIKLVASTAVNSVVIQPSNGNTTIGNVTVASGVTPGITATSLGKSEDAVHSTGDTGVAVLMLRNDTLTANTNATGDYILPTTDTYGAVYTKNVFTAKRTYSTSFTVVPAATATDIFQLIGSASTNVQVTRITITGIQTTGGQALILLQKRSTANSGGTSTAPTLIPHISTDTAATAVGAVYTANPTTGTSVGNIRTLYVPIPAATGTAQPVIIDFAEKGKPIVLTGVTQAIAINLNGVTLTGATLAISVEFTEE